MNHVWEIVNKAREEWESEAGSRTGIQQTFSIGDTNALVAAVGMGRSLKVRQGRLIFIIKCVRRYFTPINIFVVSSPSRGNRVGRV